MIQPKACTDAQIECVDEIFQRIACDLSMIADRELTISEVESQVEETRPAGAGRIHISFQLGLQGSAGVQHGCLLVPLPDAISLACCLMMVPEDVMAASRGEEVLDETTKDAMLEVGRFICGATDSALRCLGIGGDQVLFEGCQGVNPDVRPSLLYHEGDELIVGRVRASMAGFPEGTMLLVVPAQALER
jgi:hypothetical protein